MPLHPLLQLRPGQRVGRLKELHRGIKWLGQRQAAHVADEDEAARRYRFDRSGQHLQQILGPWEILHHRVQNYEVKRPRCDAGKVIRCSLVEFHLR